MSRLPRDAVSVSPHDIEILDVQLATGTLCLVSRLIENEVVFTFANEEVSHRALRILYMRQHQIETRDGVAEPTLKWLHTPFASEPLKVCGEAEDSAITVGKQLVIHLIDRPLSVSIDVVEAVQPIRSHKD